MKYTITQIIPVFNDTKIVVFVTTDNPDFPEMKFMLDPTADQTQLEKNISDKLSNTPTTLDKVILTSKPELINELPTLTPLISSELTLQ